MSNLDKCIRCNCDTAFTQDTHINDRVCYIEGAGQLCTKCWSSIYGVSSNNDVEYCKHGTSWDNFCPECNYEEFYTGIEELSAETKPTLCKVFWEFASDLEEAVNKFLKENTNVEIISTDQTSETNHLNNTTITYTIMYTIN